MIAGGAVRLPVEARCCPGAAGLLSLLLLADARRPAPGRRLPGALEPDPPAAERRFAARRIAELTAVQDGPGR